MIGKVSIEKRFLIYLNMQAKKKILYISNVDLSGKFIPGVVEKIRGQRAAFQRNDFIVDLLYPTNDGAVYIEYANGTKKKYNGARPFYTEKGLFHKLILHLRLAWFGSINFAHCIDDVQKEKYEGIYLRFYLPGRDLIKFISKVKSVNKELLLLLEYPTLNVKEILKTDLARRVSYIINSGRIRRLHKLSDYIITLTKDRELFGRPALFMPNGLDLSNIAVLPPPDFKDSLVLLGVASDCAHYHGYDKIIKGIYQYKKSGAGVKVSFRIISSLLGHNIVYLRNLVDELNLKNEVEFLDAMPRQELAAQYREVHLGVGTLALHRVGMMDNFSLKHREYAAFGLPFVMSKGDDVFENSPYVMTVERDEEPLNITKLVEFYLNIRKSDSGYPASFRKSMEKTITWDAQLTEVFRVFRNGKMT